MPRIELNLSDEVCDRLRQRFGDNFAEACEYYLESELIEDESLELDPELIQSLIEARKTPLIAIDEAYWQQKIAELKARHGAGSKAKSA